MYYTAEEKEAFYTKAATEIDQLIGAEGKYTLDAVGKMATISTVFKMIIPYFFFSGFYRVTGPDMLQIGPYQGILIACGTIPFGKGVCGVCAEKEETIIVDDVSTFPEYIACDEETKSEIVVPVFDEKGDLVAVYDVDSVAEKSFDTTDQKFLEAIMNNHFAGKEAAA